MREAAKAYPMPRRCIDLLLIQVKMAAIFLSNHQPGASAVIVAFP